jgi:malonyl-CoA/methylmalonyl-CoA synthetase
MMDLDVDRTSFVPLHDGDNVLPLSPFFTRLLRHARRKPPRPAIRDAHLGLEKTLKRETLEALGRGEEVYISLVAAGGYEYAVGFVAIAALGAAVVPIGWCYTSFLKPFIHLPSFH